MSEQTITALTAEQIADLHDLVEEQQDDVLASAVSTWQRLRRPLPPCFLCRTPPEQIIMSLPDNPAEPVKLTFEACGHVFSADRDAMAAGLRLHNERRQP